MNKYYAVAALLGFSLLLGGCSARESINPSRIRLEGNNVQVQAVSERLAALPAFSGLTVIEGQALENTQSDFRQVYQAFSTTPQQALEALPAEGRFHLTASVYNQAGQKIQVYQAELCNGVLSLNERP